MIQGSASSLQFIRTANKVSIIKPYLSSFSIANHSRILLQRVYLGDRRISEFDFYTAGMGN